MSHKELEKSLLFFSVQSIITHSFQTSEMSRYKSLRRFMNTTFKNIAINAYSIVEIRSILDWIWANITKSQLLCMSFKSHTKHCFSKQSLITVHNISHKLVMTRVIILQVAKLLHAKSSWVDLKYLEPPVIYGERDGTMLVLT